MIKTSQLAREKFDSFCKKFLWLTFNLDLLLNSIFSSTSEVPHGDKAHEVPCNKDLLICCVTGAFKFSAFTFSQCKIYCKTFAIACTESLCNWFEYFHKSYLKIPSACLFTKDDWTRTLAYQPSFKRAIEINSLSKNLLWSIHICYLPAGRSV